MPTFSKNSELLNIICKMQFVPVSQVNSFSTNQSTFGIQVDADFYDIYGTPASMLFSQKQTLTPAGSTYQQQITLTYPGFNKQNPIDLYQLDQTKHIIKFWDDADQTFIMGHPDAGATLSWQYSTQAAAHALVFTLVDTQPVGYFMPGASPGNIAFSSGFSIGFK